MTAAVVCICAVFLVFYILIPFLDARAGLRRRETFRRRLRETLGYPLPSGTSAASSGRLYGTFDGYESSNTLWLRGEGRVAALDYTYADVYYLKKGNSPDKPVLEKIQWSAVTSLDTGLPVYAGGNVVFDNGLYTFKGTQENPLFVILDDTETEDFRKTAETASFRTEKGETGLTTMLSFFIGMFLEFLILINQVRADAPSSAVILALIALCAIIVPWLPPGMLLMWLYRKRAEKITAADISEYAEAPQLSKPLHIRRKTVNGLLPLAALFVNGTLIWLICIMAGR